ncbi:16S rRNA (cytosine(1402)-N(4))-methyltransferase [Candidatus Campbellbacteria bacterium CG10_big_fil_rev_8_21_14_0_10_35_52]|uniref:Ribosomal RNA small subunit methyltransferase H n=1 Tax=Candidatus Campbellbacteria bacterium CG10_big_fil_rev_8_21_14_0_10_35_52 TaxID=1974527 RepID=A0A2M6WVV7_9BACT|nr:MAG: 16S rRNA (cytosine(1402)-N(4))-methyltransferase [Candidatus Campbellbacteria bacterium CG10_big_fil_rev_8_21_14_0_10_35_52]
MHIPVLLKEVINFLNLKEGDIVVDATINGAGHSKEICGQIGEKGTLIGIDLDQKSLDEADKELKHSKCKVILQKNNFRNLDKVLEKVSIKKANAILFDLGFSSNQIDKSGRGFSFQKDEPLLMTFKENPAEEDLTAREIVNNWEENNIADIIYAYGEEKFSRQIAKKIVEIRKEKWIETTMDLVKIIEKATPNWYKHKKIHFATKTFQALRITVNDEIGALKEGLNKSLNVLEKDGRLAVISFHSIEDRIIKQFFRNKKEENIGTIITKKIIVPNRDEILKNPRSRSAKLRIFQKN